MAFVVNEVALAHVFSEYSFPINIVYQPGLVQKAN
jgi:hypothetical protein